MGPVQLVVVIISAGVPLNGELVAYDEQGTELERMTMTP